MFLFRQIMTQLMLPVEEEAGLHLFVPYKNDPMHKGSLKLTTGALIGIPSSFNYTSIADVVAGEMTVGNVKVDWNSESGKQLANALLLSEDAKAFAVAREVQYAANYHVWVELALRSFFMCFAYMTGFQMNNHLNMQGRLKWWARGMVYTTVAASYGFLYLILSDTYTCSRDLRADRLAAKMGKNYAQGGVEYYVKILQRNQMLRRLLGSEGSNHYTLYGNVVSVYRFPKVDLTTRRDNLIAFVNDYNNEKK